MPYDTIKVCVHTDQDEVVHVEGDLVPEFGIFANKVVDECKDLKGKPDRASLTLKNSDGTIARSFEIAEGADLANMVRVVIAESVNTLKRSSLILLRDDRHKI